MSLSTEEEMALEVLKGNMATARALADKLSEEVRAGIHLLPLKTVTCERKNLRVVVFFNITAVNEHEVTIDIPSTIKAIEAWIDGKSPLLLAGVDRVELYELHIE